ncbi:hypothetical protein [Prochlorococcus marinus]|uniref:hypothetical protein n=1 Tax=Prochlorococcus marinus TaxID=1219 RepID=UPI0022B390B0|nr:hypothetical protein [Prochlorococcus marinus]
MKSILIILKKIRNLSAYFFLIAIYFFFVNLEARKDKNNNLNSEKENILPNDTAGFYKENIRIKIPVIPYKE